MDERERERERKPERARGRGRKKEIRGTRPERLVVPSVTSVSYFWGKVSMKQRERERGGETGEREEDRKRQGGTRT
jgi:hypothetical protein